ncbi:MAG: hypothetical protein LBH73_07500 [Spirochaetaceae bacterium]|jgi:hypothetical protein|nr:hypothetical protein [Spirochaetaceae bacterium]
MNKAMFRYGLFLVVTVALLFGCAHDKNSKTENQVLLQFADLDKTSFFPTGKLAYKVYGMMVSDPFPFNNILEGTDYIAMPNGSDVVIKGTIDELWRTPLERVVTTYTKENGSPLTINDFIPDQYIPMIAKESGGYFACFVSKNNQIEIQTAWGDTLIGNRPGVPHGEGDYVLCRAGPDGSPDFSDVWIVNGAVFPSTYDMTQKK